jgi:hypothetical protein
MLHAWRSTLHVPAHLAVRAGTVPGKTSGDVLHEAVEAFCRLSPDLRDWHVKEHHWTDDGGPMTALPIPKATLRLASDCRPRPWSAQQTLVAALDWYLHAY